MNKSVMIRIEEDLARKAREYGLNISKVSENALREMLRRLEQPVHPDQRADCPADGSAIFQWCGHRDLNPGQWLGRPAS